MSDDEPPPPLPEDEMDDPPPPAPADDDDDPPAASSSESVASASPPSSPIVVSPRTGPTTVTSDFEVLIREMKRLVGAAADSEEANPSPTLSAKWEEVANDPYLEAYFVERLSSVLSAARKQKIVMFAPERLVKNVKKDADVTLLTYVVPSDLKGASAYAKKVAKAEARSEENARKAAEMKEKIKNMKTTVGQILEEVEVVEEEEEVDEEGDDDGDPPPPPPPEDDDDDDPPPPPPPEDDDDDPAPPPPPDSEGDDDPPPPPPPDD